MLSELESKNKVVGLKQSKRAISEDRARKVFLAYDASAQIRREIEQLCGEKGIEIFADASMAELGDACEIDVDTAVATLLEAAEQLIV